MYLSQKSCNGGPDGEIYCTVCYQVATHPLQRKLMVLSQDNFGTNCRRPKSRATSRATSRAPSRHRSQPRTSRSQPRSRSGSLAGLDSEEGNLIVAAAMANTANIKASVGASDGCPRCGGRVFEAEKVSFWTIFRTCLPNISVDQKFSNQVVTSGGVFHRLCLSCSSCNRVLRDRLDDKCDDGDCDDGDNCENRKQ